LTKSIKKRKLPTRIKDNSQIKIPKLKSNCNEIVQNVVEIEGVETELSVFDKIWDNTDKVILPTLSWGFHKIISYEDQCICFSHMNIFGDSPEIDKKNGST
jgi:uncharacterized protein YozE (UPF0346 family)